MNHLSRPCTFLALLIFFSSAALAQQPGATATNDECSAPVFRGDAVDRKVKILAKPEPEYSIDARRRHESGVITLRAVFCGSGQVVKIRVTEGLSEDLNASAVEAARRIRFIPAEKDGQKVSQVLVLKYFLRL